MRLPDSTRRSCVPFYVQYFVLLAPSSHPASWTSTCLLFLLISQPPHQRYGFTFHFDRFAIEVLGDVVV